MIELTNDILLVVNQIADEYRKTLIEDGKVASGNLKNFTTEIKQSGKWFSIIFNLPDYWKYVENGRSAGKLPPINAIEKWITVKPIIPKSIDNKVPTTHQLAFMIARGIANNGIKPTRALQNSLNSQATQQLEDALCNLIINQLEEEINKEEI